MTRMAAESTHAHQATVEDDTIKLRYSQIVPLDLGLVYHGAAHDTLGPLQRRVGTDFVSTTGSGCGATLPRILVVEEFSIRPEPRRSLPRSLFPDRPRLPSS